MSIYNDYKELAACFADTKNGRLVRAGKEEQRRKADREKIFARNRNICENLEVENRAQESKASSSSNKAAKDEGWKVQRKLKKMMAQKNKKPIFKVGIVRHKFYSPPPSFKTGGAWKEKNANKVLMKKVAVTAISGTQSTTTISSTIQELQSDRKNYTQVGKKCLNSLFAPKNYAFKAPSNISAIPLFVHIADKIEIDRDKWLPARKNVLQSFGGQTPQSMRNRLCRQAAIVRLSEESSAFLPLASENVTVEEILLPNDETEIAEATHRRSGCSVCNEQNQIATTIRRSSSTGTVTRQISSISGKDQTQNVQDLKSTLLNETQRLIELSNDWDMRRSEQNLSEDLKREIDAAIISTRVLIQTKFDRLRSLISEYETGNSQIQLKDVEYSLYQQVEDCQLGFSKLESLWSRDLIILREGNFEKKRGMELGLSSKSFCQDDSSKDEVSFERTATDEIIENSQKKISSSSGSADSDDFRRNVTLRKKCKRIESEDEDDEFENGTAEPRLLTIPNINLLCATPTKSTPTKISSRKKSTTSEIHKDKENWRPTSMVLRSMTNKKTSQLREERSTPDHPRQLLEAENKNQRRRSTRKSCREHPGDCELCNEYSKISVQLLLTPRVRRTRAVSLLGDDSRKSIPPPLEGGDLMTFETPKMPITKSRRSSSR